MRFLIVGAGGVGGYFGGRLAAGGQDVVFMARGAHRAALAERGLEIRSPKGDQTIETPQLFVEGETEGPFDAVFVCVKLYDTEAVAEQLRPYVGPETMVVSFQNGVDAEALLAGKLGAGAILGGTCYISAEIEEPGVILHKGSFAQLVFGELDGRDSARQQALVEACTAAGVEAEASDDIQGRIWKKFVLLTPLAGATCYNREAIGPIRADAEKRAGLERLVAETAAVGRARGARLSENLEAKTLGMLDKLPDNMKASMLIDLERGNRLELDWLTGAVVRHGRDAAVAVPESEKVYAALKPLAEGG
jgi:2-dehydropantoate 2-reductase